MSFLCICQKKKIKIFIKHGFHAQRYLSIGQSTHWVLLGFCHNSRSMSLCIRSIWVYCAIEKNLILCHCFLQSPSRLCWGMFYSSGWLFIGHISFPFLREAKEVLFRISQENKQNKGLEGKWNLRKRKRPCNILFLRYSPNPSILQPNTYKWYNNQEAQSDENNNGATYNNITMRYKQILKKR